MECNKIRDISFIGQGEPLGELALLPVIAFNYLMSDPSPVICYKVDKEAFQRLVNIEGLDVIKNLLEFSIQKNAKEHLRRNIKVKVEFEEYESFILIKVIQEQSTAFSTTFLGGF